MQQISDNPIKIKLLDVEVGVEDKVFFSVTEENWTKPYVRKRHHFPETRSVILQGTIVDIKGKEVMIRLHDNNGFEKDGETYVFSQNNLLHKQSFNNLQELGVWKQDSSLNP